jgi:hypothetical protein
LTEKTKKANPLGTLPGSNAERRGKIEIAKYLELLAQIQDPATSIPGW